MSRQRVRASALLVAVLFVGCDGGGDPQPRPECITAADCTAPDGCHVAVGAACTDGACDYEPVVCAQAAPVNPCRLATGTCDANLDGGACAGLGCCLFAPAWPSGSAAAAPECPHEGEDPDANGVEDAGEVWSGTCDHAGACDECTDSIQCVAPSECVAALCTDGACRLDTTSRVGQDCPLVGGGTGRCAPDGGTAVCREKNGSSCADDAECASGACVEWVCCDGRCSGNCGSCTVAGMEGTCQPIQAACTGDCDACELQSGEYVCSANEAACGGSCGACVGSGTSFSCAGAPAKCGGDCSSCVQEGVDHNCRADPAACAGNCDECSGADTAFSCIARPEVCTGDCSACAPVAASAGFECTANQAACAGDCARCAGGDANFTCQADEAACAGNCSTCQATAGEFHCAFESAGTVCGNLSCAANNTFTTDPPAVDGTKHCQQRVWSDVALTCDAVGTCATSASCASYVDSTISCGPCQYAAASESSCYCANYGPGTSCTFSGATASNYACNGGECQCRPKVTSPGTSSPDGQDDDCNGVVDELTGNWTGGTANYYGGAYPRTCADVCARRWGMVCTGVRAGANVGLINSAVGTACATRPGDCNSVMAQGVPGCFSLEQSPAGSGTYWETTICTCGLYY